MVGTRCSKNITFRKLNSIDPSYCLKAPPPLKNAPRRKSTEPHSEEPQCPWIAFLWGRSRIRKSEIGRPRFPWPMLVFGPTAGVQQNRQFRKAQNALGRRLALRWRGPCGAAVAWRVHGAKPIAQKAVLLLGGVGRGRGVDGPAFSQGSLSRNFCVHLVYCAGWPNFFSRVP